MLERKFSHFQRPNPLKIDVKDAWCCNEMSFITIPTLKTLYKSCYSIQEDICQQDYMFPSQTFHFKIGIYTFPGYTLENM